MKKIVFLSLLFVSAFECYSQSSGMMNAAFNLSISAANANTINKGIAVDGSPYLITDEEEGLFYQKDKPVIASKTRLNYFQGNFEFNYEGKVYLIDANITDSVVCQGKCYIYKVFEVRNQKYPRVVEVIAKGAINSLYKFTDVELKPPVKAGGYVDPKPASYYWHEPLYLLEIGQNIVLLNNFKKLTDAIPGKASEVKNFIKKNNIKKNNPDDLKKLLTYLDQLN